MSLHTGLDEIRAPEPPHFSIAGIIGRSLVITLWNFIGFVGMALVIAVPALLVTWLVVQFTPFQGRIEIVNWRIVTPASETLPLVVGGFIWLVLFLMIQAAATYRAFRSLGGDHAGFGACLARSIGVTLHLGEFAVVASILLGAFAWLIYSETSWLLAQDQIGIAIFFGILLAGVCVFITAGCWVVFPVIVIERVGPVAAILRSWQLTRGRRWQIVVVMALFAAVEYAISNLFWIEVDLSLFGPFGSVALNVPFSFLGAVVLAASYYNLVGEKEGASVLSRIFV